MPVIRSAAKQLRQAKKRTAENREVKNEIRQLINKFRKSPSAKELSVVASKLAKAAKVGVIHKNKSARLLSRLSKLVKTPEKKAGKTAKKRS